MEANDITRLAKAQPEGRALDQAADENLRFGRQALSWGNGLFYAPMDLVNPFDPAAIDTEYKAGDDMLYLQYLQDSGNDLQAAVVVRAPAGADHAGTSPRARR